MKNIVLFVVCAALSSSLAQAAKISCSELGDKFKRFDPKPFLYPKSRKEFSKLKETAADGKLRKAQLLKTLTLQVDRFGGSAAEIAKEKARLAKLTLKELNEEGESAYFGVAKLGTQVFDYVNIASGDTPVQLYFFTGTTGWTGVSFEDQDNLYSSFELCRDVEFPLNDE